MMPERLITHLRHIDLAVPDFGKQLDFFTGAWGLKSEHTDTGLAFLAAEGSPEQYVVRLRQAADKRVDLIAFGAASAAEWTPSPPGWPPRRAAGRRPRHAARRRAAVTASGSSTTRAGPSRSAPTSRSARTEDRRGRVRPGAAVARGGQPASPEATRAWYEGHLGFALSDTLMHPYMGEMMWFMRINRWHHSLAIARARTRRCTTPRSSCAASTSTCAAPAGCCAQA